MSGGRRARPRALFYSSDAYGLGHISICLTILREVARQRPDALLLLVTGSLQAHAFDLPRNADYVKLPAIPRSTQYAALPANPDPATAQRGIYYLREALLQATLAFRPDVAYVDWLPAGQAGELRHVLPALRRAQPDVMLVAGLPDVTEPLAQAAWRAAGAYPLLDELYDHLVVYADRASAAPPSDYGLSPAAQARTSYSGYLCRHATLAAPETVRARLGVGDEPLILVTVGGGADGGTLLDAYLDALAEPALAGVASYVISGPLLARGEHERLAARAAKLPRLTLVPFAAELAELLNAADAVVAMAGYNTTVDIVGLGKRAVLIPRLGPDPEQLLRAQVFERQGLTRLLHPADLTPRRLAAELRAALDGPSPAITLDLGGVARLGTLIAEALPH